MQAGILLLDEPTAGLDPVGESQMIDLLVRLNRRQKVTLIIATHCVDLLPVLADRIYVLAQGRVWQEGAAARSPCRSPAGGRRPACGFRWSRSCSTSFKTVAGCRSVQIPLTVAEAEEQILPWLMAANAGQIAPFGQRAGDAGSESEGGRR